MIQILECSKEKPYRILLGKFQHMQVIFIGSLQKPTEIPLQEIPRKLTDFNTDINKDFKENSPYQKGVISEMYQRPNRSYFQESAELDSQISTGKLVQKFLPKQADIDKILKIIQRKVLNGCIYL